MTATVQIEPYKAPPISSLKPAPLNVGQADVQPASFQTLADAALRTSPPDAVKQAATTPAPPSQPANQPATPAAQQQLAHWRLRQRSSKRRPRKHRQRLRLPISCRCPSRPRRRPPLRRKRPPPISRRSNSRSPPIRRPAPGRSLRCRQANIWDRLTTFSAVKARRPRRSRGLPTRSAGAPAPGGAICRQEARRRSCTLDCGNNHLAGFVDAAIAQVRRSLAPRRVCVFPHSVGNCISNIRAQLSACLCCCLAGMTVPPAAQQGCGLTKRSPTLVGATIALARVESRDWLTRGVML